MKLKFIGNISELLEGINILSKDLGFFIAEDGIPVRVENKTGKIEVWMKNGEGYIGYHHKIHFYRALGLLVQHFKNSEDFSVSEEPQFDRNGPMFDLSRNAIMTIESFKLMFRKLAIMGLNTVMLYMEDTYEIKDEPYFGYMRGRYTYDELKTLDDYGYILGIEVIPSIQTLAHLEEFLKWDAASDLRDTRGVLLAENEKTYEFIEKMISSVSAPFRTKKLHIGMDEAEGVGRGKFLDKYGYKSRQDIITAHLNRILEIVRKYNLEPMIWSDMFLKFASETGDDYYGMDTQIPQRIIDSLPQDVQLVYWDYYHEKEEDYINLIQKHKRFGKVPAFTGGIWIWNGMGTNYGLSLLTGNAAMNACKKEGIKDIYVAMWGDDGTENNFFTALLGLQLYAEHSYTKELDVDQLKKRILFCSGIDYDAFMNLNALDEVPGGTPNNTDGSNPSKFLLWQDVLMGLFDRHVEGLNLPKHYEQLEKAIGKQRNLENPLDFIFEVPQKLCAVLQLKSEMGINLKRAYDANDKETIRNIALELIPELIKKVRELRLAHRDQWFSILKPFGWEVIDIRYGGVLSRLDTTQKRLKDYLDGKIHKIEELDAQRLLFSRHNLVEGGRGIGWTSYYYRIASANVFFHVLPI